MEFRHVGASGLVVSSIGLGTNNLGIKLDADQSRAVVHAALDAGITLIDTSDSYGRSEERLGELIAGTRDDLVLATKFGMDVRRLGGDNGEDWGARGSRRYIRRAVESSLRRLRTEWIDLYQFHKPDPGTPILETLETLDDLVREGKVRYIAHSNFSGFLTADAQWTARAHRITPFIADQSRYSLLDRGVETELIPALQHYGMSLIPHSPLAGGLLSGKYRRGQPAPADSRVAVLRQQAVLTDPTFDRLEAIERFAADRERSMLEVALGWLVAQPVVASVVVGATSPSQLSDNLAAAEWRPSAEDLAELDASTR